MRMRTADVSPDTAYQRVSDFARYPELTATVLSVHVEPAETHDSVVSSWLVAFRKGQLRWTERDVLDAGNRRIEFTQLSGDFASFDGVWQVDPDGAAGAVVSFGAWFDLGIPSLAEILDPVAEATLRNNIELILTGLLGPVVEVDAERITAGV